MCVCSADKLAKHDADLQGVPASFWMSFKEGRVRLALSGSPSCVREATVFKQFGDKAGIGSAFALAKKYKPSAPFL